MHISYGNGHNLPAFTQIIPAEAMTGDNRHDYAVFCALLTAAKIMTHEELVEVAELLPLHIRRQVADTCKRIIQEQQGFIWLQRN